MELPIGEPSTSKRLRMQILDDDKSLETKTTAETEKESAPNILDILNDFCLQEIFKRISIVDLSNATEVCKRFRQNAEQIFSLCHEKRFRFVSLTLVKPTVFRNFVHLMKSVYLNGRQANSCLEMFNEQSMIQSLHLRDADIAVDKLKPLLPKLKSLQISSCDFVGVTSDMFSYCRKLEYLGIKWKLDAPFPFPLSRLPKLKKFECHNYYTYTEHLRRFIEDNPQLSFISITAFNKAAWAPEHFEKHLEKLGKFESLNSLKLPCFQFYVTPLTRSLCTKNIPMQQLELFNCRMDDESFRDICQMKAIKILTLTGIKALSGNLFVDLAKELPQLEVLRLLTVNGNYTSVTIDDIKSFVRQSKNLYSLCIGSIKDMTIDQSSYKQLLQFVKQDKRKTLTITIIYENTMQILVPERTVIKNNNILIVNIKRAFYFGSDDGSIGESWDNNVESGDDSDSSWLADVYRRPTFKRVTYFDFNE